MSKATEPDITIETCNEGHHTARYRMKLWRFLLSDGQVLDITAARDDSNLRAAVIAAFAAGDKDVRVEGVTRLPDDGAARGTDPGGTSPQDPGSVPFQLQKSGSR